MKRKKIVGLLACALVFSIMLTLPACNFVNLSKLLASSQSSASNQSSTSSQSSAASSIPEGVLVKSADGSVSITVPDGWNTKDTSLNDLAVIGVSNQKSNQFLIIIREPKSDFAENFTINDYMDAVKNSMSSKFTNGTWGDISNVTIGGCNALATKASATYEKFNFVYWVNIVDGKDSFYQVLGYTLKSGEKTSEPVIQKIVNTFQETASADGTKT